jgi:phosphate starvation-inducible PhoH-like protein
LDTTAVRVDLTLKPEDNHRLASLYGQLDEHLRQIERRLNVKISCRGPQISIFGDEEQAQKVKRLLKQLYEETLDHEITTCLIANSSWQY